MSYLQKLHDAHKARLRRLTVPISLIDPPPEPLDKAIKKARRRWRLRPGGGPGAPSIFAIQSLVAKTYGVSAGELVSPSRKARHVTPRSIAIHLACRLTAERLVHIALRFGGRHHSTALHADRRMLQRRQQNPAFDAELHALERELTS
jgi:chromosomal replication initiation ATPase DnaA